MTYGVTMQVQGKGPFAPERLLPSGRADPVLLIAPTHRAASCKPVPRLIRRVASPRPRQGSLARNVHSCHARACFALARVGRTTPKQQRKQQISWQPSADSRYVDLCLCGFLRCCCWAITAAMAAARKLQVDASWGLGTGSPPSRLWSFWLAVKHGLLFIHCE